jgi:hypothetical protein
MSHIQAPGVAAQPTRFLSDRENERAVDLIESAERSAPYCHCGRHMIAVADEGRIWLECSGRSGDQTGLAGILARLSAFGHTRRLIMDLPTS